MFNASGVPMLGPKPKEVEIRRPIVPFRLQDKDGVAECAPQDDLTPLESWQITLLVFYCTSQPPPFHEPKRNEIVKMWTPWRQYIADHKLERHFTFSQTTPVNQVGHG
jgi:hypothetical protein